MNSRFGWFCLVLAVVLVIAGVLFLYSDRGRSKSIQTKEVNILPADWAATPRVSTGAEAEAPAASEKMQTSAPIVDPAPAAPLASVATPPPVLAGQPPEPGGAALPAIAHSAVPENLTDAMRERIMRFKDTSVPLETRLNEVAELGKKGDAESAAILMALGREEAFLNYAAVEALGGVKADGVEEYLKRLLSTTDPKVLTAAVKSLAKLQGAAAVPTLAETVKANRQRPDGFQDVVCAACVQALGDTRSAQAVPVLDAELRESVGVAMQHEYGSEIVKALVAIDSVEARLALLAYVEKLNLELPAQADNPMGSEYLKEKIKEAQDAAAAVGKNL